MTTVAGSDITVTISADTRPALEAMAVFADAMAAMYESAARAYRDQAATMRKMQAAPRVGPEPGPERERWKAEQFAAHYGAKGANKLGLQTGPQTDLEARGITITEPNPGT